MPPLCMLGRTHKHPLALCSAVFGTSACFFCCCLSFPPAYHCASCRLYHSLCFVMQGPDPAARGGKSTVALHCALCAHSDQGPGDCVLPASAGPVPVWLHLRQVRGRRLGPASHARARYAACAWSIDCSAWINYQQAVDVVSTSGLNEGASLHSATFMLLQPVVQCTVCTRCELVGPGVSNSVLSCFSSSASLLGGSWLPLPC